MFTHAFHGLTYLLCSIFRQLYLYKVKRDELYTANRFTIVTPLLSRSDDSLLDLGFLKCSKSLPPFYSFFKDLPNMSTQPKIYRSSLPLTPLIQESIFTYLMESTYHKYDPLSPAFIDADSRISITRAKLKHLSLRLGFGLRNHILLPSIQDPRSLTTLTRGDTVMVFGSNTMSWPATVFG